MLQSKITKLFSAFVRLCKSLYSTLYCIVCHDIASTLRINATDTVCFIRTLKTGLQRIGFNRKVLNVNIILVSTMSTLHSHIFLLDSIIKCLINLMHTIILKDRLGQA